MKSHIAIIVALSAVVAFAALKPRQYAAPASGTPKLAELYVVYSQDAADPSQMNMTLYGDAEVGHSYLLQFWSRSQTNWIDLWVEGPIPPGKTSLDWTFSEGNCGLVKARWVDVTP